MADIGGNWVARTAQSEHIGPSSTGDNVDAKKTANYSFGSDSNWARTPLPLVDKPFDYVSFTNADGNGNYQTWTFKQGGAAGTTVRTMTVAYDGSNNITSIARS